MIIRCTECRGENIRFLAFRLRPTGMLKEYHCDDCKKDFYVPADILAPKKKKIKERKCLMCGRTDKYHAKGLCNSCYAMERRRKK